MRSVYDYLIEPIGGRYNNTKKVGDKNLIVNTEIFNHQHINREATIKSTPSYGALSCVGNGSVVMVHHNVFRRWHNIRGEEKNSRSFIGEDTYVASQDQMYLYKPNKSAKDWSCFNGYCFVQPIKDTVDVNSDVERPLTGIVKYSDGTVEVGSLVGFYPGSEFEFVVDGQRMYRVLSKSITIKYEYQGNEEEYNPSWANSR
tara:strand:+ start:1435 stop:2037 length:603 start_codon:yes stop_codon:yes gene_type:complete